MEQNFAAFNAIFCIEVNDVIFNVSNHNGTLLADHFMVLQFIPRVLYSINQFLIDTCMRLLLTTF